MDPYSDDSLWVQGSLGSAKDPQILDDRIHNSPWLHKGLVNRLTVNIGMGMYKMVLGPNMCLLSTEVCRV